jgi:hypothetical protein
MDKAVADSTLAAYQAGERRWQDFFRLAYPKSQPGAAFRTDQPHPTRVQVLIAFIHYLADDLHLSPSAIKSSLAGVRHAFRSRLLDQSFLDDPLVTSARTAIRNTAPQAQTETGPRAPFTLEMVRSFATATTRERMVATGALLGYFNLMRGSEFCVTRTSNHTIRAKDVEFEVTLPEKATALIPAHAIATSDEQYIQAVRITVTTAKNLRKGTRPTPTWFSILPAKRRAAGEVCMASALFDWAREANYQSAEDIFLSYRTGTSSLRQALMYEHMNSAIKAVARRFGLDPSRFGTHSLRIGGATSLHAAGASAITIQQAGKWRSLPVACQYPQPTSQGNDRQLQLLQQTAGVSTRDLHMALPTITAPVLPRRSSGRHAPHGSRK